MGLAIKRYLKFISLPGKAIVLLITIGACLQVGAFAQDRDVIDSLRALLRHKQDTVEYALLRQLAYEYEMIDQNDSVLVVSQKAYDIACALGDTVRIVKSGARMARVLELLSRPKDAEEKLLKLLPIAFRLGLDVECGFILNVLMLTNISMAKYDNALRFGFLSLHFRKRLDLRAISFNNIGFAYYKLENFDKAIFYYNQCLKLKRQIEDDYDVDRLLINLSLCYVYKGHFDEAGNLIKEVTTLCAENCSDQIRTELLFTKGLIALRKGEVDVAEEYFLTSYSISTETENFFKFENIVFLAQIFITKGKLDLAKRYLMLAEKEASEQGFNSIKADFYRLFSLLYEKERNFLLMVRYQKKYISIRDSLYSDGVRQNLMAFHAEHEQSSNITKIESQKRILVLKQQIIERQSMINLVIFIAAILLLLILAVLYWDNAQRKSVSKRLEQRVRVHTMLLEERFLFLEKRYTEHEFLVTKTFMEVKSIFITLTSVCKLAKRDNCYSNTYLNKIETAISKLRSIIHQH